MNAASALLDPERVIFRVWTGKDGGDVIAFFPDTYGPPNCNPGMMQSYMHVGQHGEADYYVCLQRTRPARAEEFADLLAELIWVYSTDEEWKFKIVRRFNRR